MGFGDFSARFKKASAAKQAEDATQQGNIDPVEVEAIRARITGVLVRDARVAKGFSTEHLAQLMYVTNDTIISWEFGQRSPSLPQLELLAYWLEVPVSHFISGTETLVNQLGERQLDQYEYQKIRDHMIGTQVRLLRQERGFTVEYLAQQTDIELETLQAYEYGNTTIPMTHLAVLASALRVNVTQFLEGNNRVGSFLQAHELFDEFLKMNPEVRDFISQPANQQYIELAMKLAEMDTQKMRLLAEMLLEITL